MAPERRPAGDVIECYKYTFGKTPGEACEDATLKMNKRRNLSVACGI